MKFFIKKVLFFSLTILTLLILSELIIPSTLTTFRSWEANISASPFIIGKFFPNQKVIRNEVGDLAHHTKWQINKKNINWKSDSIGFRNKKYEKDIDILFIGASNITGCGTSQENILSETVRKKTNFITYNIAPNNFQEFINLLKADIINPPKILIYGNIERSIPHYQKIKTANHTSIKQKLKTKLQKIVPVSLAIIFGKLRVRNTKSFIKARVSNGKGKGVQSPIDNKMFFVQGNKSLIQDDSTRIEKTAEIIKSYSEYCDSIGVKFIFLPIPNKETIYFDLVPFEVQPTYLNKLIEKLSQKEIKVINTVEIFNKEKENILLYHFDDSHWNKNAIMVTTNEITRLATLYMR